MPTKSRSARMLCMIDKISTSKQNIQCLWNLAECENAIKEKPWNLIIRGTHKRNILVLVTHSVCHKLIWSITLKTKGPYNQYNPLHIHPFFIDVHKINGRVFMESLWKGNAIPNNKLAPVTKHLDQYATVLQVVQGMLFLMVEGIRPTFKYNVIQKI